MRKSSYFAMSVLLTALSAQAADTMGPSPSTTGSSGYNSGTATSPMGPSSPGTNTTPMQNPVGATPGTPGTLSAPQGNRVNTQGTMNTRDATVDTTSTTTSAPLTGAAPTTTTSTSTTTGSTPSTVTGTAPDNTRINQRDAHNQTMTPGDQSNTKADVSTTSAVRQALVKSDMSTSARNVKIITNNGRITLRGPVKTQAEKARIEALAKAAANGNTVDNQLDVKATTY